MTLHRSATLAPKSLNREARTFRATVSTGAEVQRRDARGFYCERLDLAPVDPKTLIGKPLVNSHRTGSIDDTLGVVTDAGRDDTGLWVEVRLSKRAEPYLDDIEHGVLGAVSIGYTAAKTVESIDPATKGRALTITPAIHEVSLVPIGADPKARVRSKKEGKTMTTENPTETEDAPEPAETADTRPATRGEILGIVRKANLTDDFADRIWEEGATVLQARAAAFAAMTETSSRQRIVTTRAPSNDDPSVMLTRMAEGIVARHGGPAPSEAARPYASMEPDAMCRAYLASRSVRIAGLSTEEIRTRAYHGTSDFPGLLTETGNRVLLESHRAAQSPIKTALARRSEIKDFRPKTMLKIGGPGQLQEVTESGEIKSVTAVEAKESYGLGTDAAIFHLSGRAIANDDLGPFVYWGAAMGRAAAETENARLVALLTQSNGAGPLMGDGKRLFHADHGNLAATGGPLDRDGLSTARLAMRMQKGLDGKTPIAATPRYVLVGADLETDAEIVLTEIYAATVGDVNPFGGRLSLLVEPRLPPEAWYVFADPAVMPVLEYAYLSSAPGPQLASRESFETWGRSYRVLNHFGCGAVDWRGAYRNTGDL
jgi:HK97 family phage prohead protease